MTLRVWGFGWDRISTRSAFAVSQDNLKRSLPGNRSFNGEYKAAVLRNFYSVMQQHGISPTVVHYLPRVTNSGNVAASDWATTVAPYLDEGNGAVGLQDNQVPFLRWFPWSRSQSPSSAAILTYLKQMTAAYKARGWDRKSYVYVLDETTKTLRGAAGRALRPPAAQGRQRHRRAGQVPPHRRPAAALARRHQDGQHVPLRRRRHLDAALLLLLRAHPRGARAPERRQGDLVVHRTPTTPWAGRRPSSSTSRTSTRAPGAG